MVFRPVQKKMTLLVHKETGEPLRCSIADAGKYIAKGFEPDGAEQKAIQEERAKEGGPKWSEDNVPSEATVNKMKQTELQEVVDLLELPVDLKDPSLKKIGQKRAAVNEALEDDEEDK